ncbi:short-chain dehydrogenase/reductase family protein [Purpureocillium lavendulum]|uniref:Short-chain dehydrogenase/reductase family protein n=1 Tax=Purpureocillium lavendulum TaxID=1247861 RepID=A0AB34FMK5_9HYPO|nr:short-chain dehydrogenase/reductase family protein [Purpureocillium lavendulum]
MASTSVRPVRSQDMPPLPSNFLPVFIRNQFFTMIELPTKEAYPDVDGKCAIITGSNTGLGFESAAQLLSLGLSHLIMAVRSLEKGEAAAAQLRSANPASRIDVWHLDMESYASVQDFVRRCEGSLSRIDVVILNAGMSPSKFATVPATGHERAIQVNHISTALLAILLLPVLKSKSAGVSPPRLTIVNSAMAHLCAFPNKRQRPLLASFDDTAVTPFSSPERYGVSKLLCQLLVVRLARMVDPADITINMVDPGLTKGTGLSRESEGLLGLINAAALAICGRLIA